MRAHRSRARAGLGEAGVGVSLRPASFVHLRVFNIFVLIFDGLTAVLCARPHAVVFGVAVLVPSFGCTMSDSRCPCADCLCGQSFLGVVQSTGTLGGRGGVWRDLSLNLLLHFWGLERDDVKLSSRRVLLGRVPE